MRIPVNQLRQQVGLQASYTFECEIPSLIQDGVVVFTRPASVEAVLTNTGDSILAEVKAEAVANLRCGRCLESFELPVSTRFRVEFREGTGPAPEDEDVALYSGDYIDLSDEVRQNIIVSLPMKPLCDEACKGLCPWCGVNLNVRQCACEPPVRDERWSVLEKLGTGLKGQGSES
ncbi:MAG: YceD family protein [Ignavibacteriales bacterium]